MNRIRESLSLGWKIALGCIAAVVIIFVLIFAISGISQGTAEIRGGTDAREKTVGNGSYRIAAYDQFYDLNAAVETLEGQICTMKSAEGLPANQRATNVLALTNQRTALVNEYNNDAEKAGTIGQFRASNLPSELSQEMPSC